MTKRENRKKMSNAKRAKLELAMQNKFQSVAVMNNHLVSLDLPEVNSIEEAVEMIKSMFLNIVDFVNGIIKPFKCYADLVRYTKRERKYFSRVAAKAIGIDHLLVKLF